MSVLGHGLRKVWLSEMTLSKAALSVAGRKIEFPYTWPIAYTTACTIVQAVITNVKRITDIITLIRTPKKYAA